MSISNYSLIEEELIGNNFQKVLHTLRVYHLLSERVGLEMAMQNGRVCASNLNFYKTRPDALGDINCVVTSLSDSDREKIKNHVFDILQTLSVRVPYDMFGQLELVAEFDPLRKMRIKNLLLNMRSSFKLQSA